MLWYSRQKMETVDLFGRNEGNIWVRSAVIQKDGLVIRACNTEKGATVSGRRLSFTKVAFSPANDVLFTSDYLGNVYRFDLEKNRYVYMTWQYLVCVPFSM